MIRQELGIKSKCRGPAFRAIEEILRSDPVLSGVVKTWRSREGTDNDMQPVGYDQLPLVSLSPVPRPNTILGVDENKVNFAVSVELWVQGTCVDDILALWEAIEDAILHGKPFRDTTVADYLCNLLGVGRGVWGLRAEAPGFFPVERIGKGQQQVTPDRQGGLGMLLGFFSRPS